VSFSFYIATPKPPSFGAFVDALREPGWAIDDAPEEEWAASHCLHPYVRGKSARGIELVYEEQRIQVRIMTCSTTADYELGVRAACVLAEMTKSAIEPEDGSAMSVDEARATYGKLWIDDMVVCGADLTLFMAVERGPLSMSGARRDIHVGKRFVSELRAMSGPATPAARLLDAILRLQNVDEEQWFPANPFLVKTNDGKQLTLTAWGANCNYLFPETNYFALLTDGDPLIVPHEAGPTIAANKWEWLDEKNALVTATADDVWPRMLDLARKFAIKPF
jgi:hypothetical protein